MMKKYYFRSALIIILIVVLTVVVRLSIEFSVSINNKNEFFDVYRSLYIGEELSKVRAKIGRDEEGRVWCGDVTIVYFSSPSRLSKKIRDFNKIEYGEMSDLNQAPDPFGYLQIFLLNSDRIDGFKIIGESELTSSKELIDILPVGRF